MAQADDWLELKDPEEFESPPEGSDDHLDDSGYSAADDPATAPPTGTAPPGEAPTRGGKYPVSPAAIPPRLKGLANGNLPDDALMKVAPLSGTMGSLIPEAAAAWRNLQNAASAAGFTLTMTNGYRNLQQQQWLFEERYQLEPNGGKSKTWNGKAYYLKSPKLAQAASPGTSNHGWGCAVDMALGGYGNAAAPVAGNSAFMAWVVQNAGPLGWSWEVQSEPWHIRLVSYTAATATPRTASTTPMQAPLPVLKEGSKGGQVAALQSLCGLYQWGEVGRADGTFGPRTKVGVQAMQTALSAKPDGEYGPKSAAALGAFLASAPA